MNSFVKILASISFIVFANTMQAQPLMETVKDAYKLKEMELLFRDKPLGILLKEVGPDVKRVLVESNRAHGAVSFIVFWFEDLETLKKEREAGRRNTSITVMVKENIEWNKSKEETNTWTKKDAENLAYLTIAYIRVSGEGLAK